MTNEPEPNTRPLPQPSELVDLIERLESHMGKQDPQILLADCREAASELRAQSAQIAKLQADGDKLAGFTYHRTNCPASWPAPLTGDCTCGLTQALAAKGDSRG